MNEKQYYPPIVVVLGHVDHGKTTLLDAIRKTEVAKREHGGITQKIGASTIFLSHEGKERAITFIDTPGHETFAKMRSRGATVADIALLIVSSLDGVMPQTKESIVAIRQANIPFIVVLTKADLPNKAVEKTKQQLLKEGVMLEGLGGDVPVIEVSGKTGHNVQALLELILLVFAMQAAAGQKGSHDLLAAVVIESQLDQKAGPRATVVVKSGTLAVRDNIVADGVSGRVRTLLNDRGERITKVTVGDAVEVLGFEEVPAVGSTVAVRSLRAPQSNVAGTSDVPLDGAPPRLSSRRAPPSAPTLALPVSEGVTAHSLHAKEYPLSVILRADTAGCLEAIVHVLPQEVHIVSQKTGEPTESDVVLAKTTGAIILAFNVKTKASVIKLAKTEKVLLKHYAIIYELIKEVKDVVAGKKLVEEVTTLGTAKVLASFPYEKALVLGVAVFDGRIVKGDRVELKRGDAVIGESTIASLKQGKQTVSKVEKGQQAGVLLSPPLDFTIGDVLTSVG